MDRTARSFFSNDQQEAIQEAIREAEHKTSGEIRVQIETNCPGDLLDRAAYVFLKLKLHKTAHRNAILFYLSVEDRKFAVIGDAGINAVVPENFWDRVKGIVASYFSRGEFVTGLCEGILKAGEQMQRYFPIEDNDENELADEISFELPDDE